MTQHDQLLTLINAVLPAISDADRRQLRERLAKRTVEKSRNHERNRLYFAYFVGHYSDLSIRAAASAIDADLTRYESGDWRFHAGKTVLSVDRTTDKTRALFEMLKAGRRLKLEAIRKVLVGTK